MTKVEKNINIHGSNNVVADTIQNSFNQIQSSGASDEIKGLLTELTKQVDALCKHLNEDEAAIVKQDLETLAKEAAKEKPSKKIFEIKLESLKKAAENIGEIAGPVAEIAVKLMPLIIAAAQQAR